MWQHTVEQPQACQVQNCMQECIATSMEQAASTAAVGISTLPSRPQLWHSLEEMPLMQRLGALKAKLAAPHPPHASASDSVTDLVPSSASCQHQEPIISSTAPAPLATPGPSPAQTRPPAKKARRLVPSLPIAGQAQENSINPECQEESPAGMHPEPASAAIHSDLMSVFSFL